MPSYRLSDLARRVGGEVRGKDFDVEGVAPLDRAGSRELSFLTHPKYRDRAAASAAGALLVAGAEDLGDRPLLISSASKRNGNQKIQKHTNQQEVYHSCCFNSASSMSTLSMP